jgi:D-amino-acid dehydrogenase
MIDPVTPPTADVVVIGGGLVGTALAYELVTAGADVVLVDRHDPGRATDAGAGILSPETNQDPDPLLFRFGAAAAGHYQSLIERLTADGVQDTGFQVTGSLLVAQRPGDDLVMDETVQLVTGRSHGLMAEMSETEARRLFPPLGPVRRALFNPAARRVDGRVLSAALRQAATSRGLRTVLGHGAVEAATGGSEIDAVRTSEGPILTGAVVVAGGAWSAEMSAALEVTLPVVPLKGQIVHLSLPQVDSSSWPIVQPVLGFYLVPWPDGRVACGGTMEAEAGFDHRPTADGLHQLLRECLRTAPGLAQAAVLETRVGSRPATPDGRPIIGRVAGWPNVFVATGHGAEGLLLGPYSALVVARMVLGRQAPVPEEGALVENVLHSWGTDRFTG